jgi:hypothetical protein
MAATPRVPTRVNDRRLYILASDSYPTHRTRGFRTHLLFKTLLQRARYRRMDRSHSRHRDDCMGRSFCDSSIAGRDTSN